MIAAGLTVDIVLQVTDAAEDDEEYDSHDSEMMIMDTGLTPPTTDDSGIDSITVSPSVEDSGVLQTLLHIQETEGEQELILFYQTDVDTHQLLLIWLNRTKWAPINPFILTPNCKFHTFYDDSLSTQRGQIFTSC